MTVGLLLFPIILAAAPESELIKRLRTIELNDGGVRCVAISPDGNVVGGCGDRFVQLFDVKTGERLHRLEGHTRPVLSIAFTPDGQLVASSSADGTVRLWNVKTGQHIKTLAGRQRTPIACLAIAPDTGR